MFKVRVVSYSKPAIGVDLKDDLLQMVAYCARVSNPGNQNNEETAEKLVKYLIKHQHWSPLEMASVCMEIDTTRDIARQILRHRSFSFQEFSQRYADPTKDLSFVSRVARMQDTTNRQNSVDIPMEDSIHHIWESYQEVIIERCKHAYEWAISAGIAKEQARAILPEGLTMSRMYVNGTLRSWIHYIQLRSANGTQQEHQEIARACAEAIYQIFPLDDVI
jgi:thymidylate synthase (FAD)